MVMTAPDLSGRFAAYGAAHRFHEPATDRQAEPGSGADPVTLSDR
jgi:hypothetical protein